MLVDIVLIKMNDTLYPTIEFPGQVFIFPLIPLPENFRELVARFYEQGRDLRLNTYVDNLNEYLTQHQIPIRIDSKKNLTWDRERGLVRITMSPGGGLDLRDDDIPGFVGHELEGFGSFVAPAVATKYISELLECQEGN